MKTTATLPSKKGRAGLKKRTPKQTISERIDIIEMATVSSLRALQMEIENDSGIDSETVLRNARSALR